MYFSYTNWLSINIAAVLLQVIKLINCLPKLSFLNLSNNILGGALVNPPPFTSLFPSLTTLILNRVGIEWDDLVPYLSLTQK